MPELERKPGGLTTLGVLCVLFGIGWIVSAAWGLLHPQVHAATVERSGAPQLLTGIGLTGAYVQAAGTVLLGGLMFAAGVGLLRLKKWGARLAKIYAVGQIAWSVVGVVINVLGPLSKRVPAEKLPKPYAETMQHDFLPVSVTEIVAGLLLSTVFAVILLCLLSRKGYKDPLT